MKITIELPTELVNKIVDGIMANYPECSATLECLGWKYASRQFKFVDTETEEIYNIDEARLHRGFALLFTDKWPKGCVPVPLSTEWDTWDNWLCNCDATDFDAFVQLVCLGEVIYG